MKPKLIAFAVMALAFVPALVADNHLDGVQTVQYDVLLSPSHESPPLEGVDASGNAAVEIIVTRAAGVMTSAIVDFHVNWRAGQEEELLAFHIHRGAAGVNGPVVVNPRLTPRAPSMGGSVFRQAVVMDPTGLAVIEEILANPGGFYLNLHSASSPSGFIRGQLQPDTGGLLAATEAKLAATEARLQEALDIIDTMLRAIGNFPPRN